jgi:quinol monooxygenase YgiN
MILVVGTIRCPVENLEALKPSMAAVVAASRAEKGCIEYAYGADMLDPGLIRVVEAWRDRDALAAHFKAPHMDPWRAARAALGVGERNLSLYESSDPEPI